MLLKCRMQARAEGVDIVRATMLCVSHALTVCVGGVGIYPSQPAHAAHMLDMMSDDWTISWEEVPHSTSAALFRSLTSVRQIMRMVVFQRTLPNGSFVRHYLLLNNIATFIRLVNLCSSIKMYVYTNALPA